ncbi:SPOR domain-containing protein [Legionella fairfieldensis]|uniref:SPOR domain-containing protein n=1 Tax=Legionella fairfieldensis TaxID=45064 RepID=UPI0004907C9D|nr:SPOR domain-containing protein [Legionella fairfieldensis]
MKLVIDERVKHRLIGLAVILSIGAIFAPAIMKKSNQRFDNNVNLSVELPPKPAHPNVAMVEKEAMFQTIKVAHVEIPDDPEEQDQSLATFAKAEPLSQRNEIKATSMELEPAVTIATKIGKAAKPLKTDRLAKAMSTKVTTPEVAARQTITKKSLSFAKVAPKGKNRPEVIAKIKKTVKPIPKTTVKGAYGVQLATFAKRNNADTLISRLRHKGYKATYNTISTPQGTVYKVIVGQMPQKEKARLLQRQLADAVQIKGFIVTTGQG